MSNNYDNLPILNIIVDIHLVSEQMSETNVAASINLNPSNVQRALTPRESAFKSFLETIYKQLRDDNGGYLDIIENHYTDRPDKVSNYIYGYFVMGKFTRYQYLIELRISDHPQNTSKARRNYFRKEANFWDMINSHGPDDYKDSSNSNNAYYIPIDVDISTQWTNVSTFTQASDVKYLRYSSYQDAINKLANDILSELMTVPQVGVLGYKNYILYKTKGKDEYTVFKDTNRRNILIRDSLDNVCNFIDNIKSLKTITSTSKISDYNNQYLDEVATALECDLDEEFYNYAPFRCVRIYIKDNILIINILDNTYQGYTCEFDINTTYEKILAEFIDIFDETYQYDNI